MSGKSKKFGRNARRPSTKARKAELRWQKNARLRTARHAKSMADHASRLVTGDIPAKGFARDARRMEKQIAYAAQNGLDFTNSRFPIHEQSRAVVDGAEVWRQSLDF